MYIELPIEHCCSCGVAITIILGTIKLDIGEKDYCMSWVIPMQDIVDNVDDKKLRTFVDNMCIANLYC